MRCFAAMLYGLVSQALLTLTVLADPAPQSCSAGAEADGGCVSSAANAGGDSDLDSAALLQVVQRAAATTASTPRVRIKGTSFWIGEGGAEQEVALMGGNYVIKARPYYPDPATVRKNAKEMSDGARQMKYKPSGGRKGVPVVRLGALMEGAMPDGPGSIDQGWAAKLDETVKAFAAEGVYVLLDAHQDAWCTTNGGEGLPWWMTAKMQESCHKPYVVSPEHPLESMIPSVLETGLGLLGINVPGTVEVVNTTQPWLPFSVGGSAGDPAKMNVGNQNLRANNDDHAWSAGTLILSKQVGNVASRFYGAPFSPVQQWKRYHGDREHLFDPYITFLKHLCSVWQANSNVVAVELLNEPPPAGLPDVKLAALSRTRLFDWYSAVLDELADTEAPLAFEDLLGTVKGASTLDYLLDFVPPSLPAQLKLRERARKGQLIFSFHYYPGIQTQTNFTQQVKLAEKEAETWGGIPVWLTEYWDASAQVTADNLALAVEAGCAGAIYWQYVDSEFTGNRGWFKYTPEVQAAGGPDKAWDAYLKTVNDGTYWGAAITGSGGGHSGVLQLVPDLSLVTQVARDIRPLSAASPSKLGNAGLRKSADSSAW